MNWLDKLERKYSRFCIHNLISLLIAGQIVVYAVELFVNPYISLWLGLDRAALLGGRSGVCSALRSFPSPGAGR